MKSNRRQLLKQLIASSAVLPLVSFRPPDTKSIPDNLKVLFQGDSITDGGRDRSGKGANDPQGMGGGYVRHAVTELLGLNADKDIQFFNRGISGNKVFQLLNRWEEDCLDLGPNVLSILIGVNDFWHTLSNTYKGTVEKYESDYRILLDKSIERIPDLKIIIGEPFVCLDGTDIIASKWKIKFPDYQRAAKSIADDYNAVFIPYQSIFDKAVKIKNTAYWCPDGVHPSMAGSYLMANAWMAAFYELYD